MPTTIPVLVIGNLLAADPAAAAKAAAPPAPATDVAAFRAQAWKVVETELDDERKKGGDQGILYMEGARFLLLDAKGKLEDHGKVESPAPGRVLFRNHKAVMDFELRELDPKRAVLAGNLISDLAPTLPMRMVLVPVKKAPRVPAPKSLDQAADLGDLAAVERMLSAPGKTPPIDELHDGVTALMSAAFRCHTPVVKALLDAGAKTDLRAANGKTALHLAVEGGDVETVKLLLAKGADVHAVNDSKETPIVGAVSAGSLDLTKALVDAGANLHDRGEYGDTLLSMAASGAGLANRPMPEVITYLLDHKGDDNELGRN